MFLSQKKMSHIRALISKADINHLCFPSTFIFHVFLPNNYPRNVTLTPILPEKPRCLLTPPPTTVVLTPASCGLGLVVVSVLVELCDVGGGSSVECCSSGGGDGLKVILVRFTTQTQQKETKTTVPFLKQGCVLTN